MALSGRSLTALSGLTLTIVMPTLTTLEDVGKIYYLITLATLLSIITRWGIDSSANSIIASTNNASEERNAKSKLLAYSITSNALFTLSTCLLISISVLPGEYSFGNKDAFAILLLAFPTSVSFMMFHLYRIDGRIILSALSRGFFLNTALILALLVTYDSNATSITTCAGVMLTIVTAANILHYIRTANLPSPNLSLKEIPKYFSGKLTLYTILLYFTSESDIYFIRSYLTFEELGIYASIKRLAILLTIYTDIAHLVLPSIFKSNIQEGKQNETSKVFRQFSFAGFICASIVLACFSLYPEALIRTLWGESYEPGTNALLIILGCATLTLACGFNEMWLLLEGSKNALAISMLIALTTSLALNFFLTPIYGISGAAVAFALPSLTARLILTIYVYKKYHTWLIMRWN